MTLDTLGPAGYAVAGVAYAGLAALLLVRRRGDFLGNLLLACIAIQALWGIAYATISPQSGPVWNAALSLVEALRGLSWILFLLALALHRSNREVAPDDADRSDTLSGAARRGLVTVSVLAALSAATAWAGAGPYAVFGARTLLAIFGLVCLEQVYRNAAQGRRWALKYLGLALLALFGLDFLFYSEAMMFGRLNPVGWDARGYANAMLVPLLAIAAARNPDWNLDVGVSRKVVFHSAALSLAGAYLLLISAGGYWLRWFGGDWGQVAQALLMFGALLSLAVALASGTVRAQLRVFLAKHFFSYRFDYREEWLKLTRLLSSAAPDELPLRALEALGSGVESRSGAIWLEQDGAYRFTASIGWRQERATIAADSALVRLLREHEWVIDLERWRTGADEGRQETGDAQHRLELPHAIAAHDEGWLIVPLLLEGELIGFVLLDQPLAPHPLDWETLDLLKAAAHQVASHFAMQRTLKQLIQTQQFDSFNRMSAFVVHDLKNLVSQLSLLTRNAKKHRDNPEFQDDMLATVENVMERMQGLLLQLRAGTRPVEAPSALRLSDVLQAAVAARRGLQPIPGVDVADGASDTMVTAHRDRLERVIGHLIQNAADASGTDGHLQIRLLREPGRALVEVQDDGVGMSETFIRDKLFAPFESTKAHGMGIGAFESREYLREIGGALEVSSTEGVGTTFRIGLPLATATQ